MAALAATGVVSAQSSVTVAGIIDQAYHSVTQNSRDGVNKTKQTGFGEGAWAGSRIRFSGSEDMGGGLRANFWIEQGIAPSDGSGFNYRNGGNAPQIPAGAGMTAQIRQAYVGLSGGFGEIRVGRLYTAGYDMWTLNQNIINTEFTGTTQATFGVASRTKGLSYQSPKIGDFRFYGTIGGRDSEHMNTESTENQVNGFRNRKEELTTASLLWSSGQARAGVAYETMTQQCSATSTTSVRGAAATVPANFFGVTAATGLCTNTNSIDSSMWAVQGGYNFGVADVTVLFGKKEVDGSFTSTSKVETNLQQINVKVPLTGTAIELRYTYNLQDAKTAGTKSSDIKGHFMNANYAFSKRTRGYVSYGVAKDSVASQGVTNEEKRFAVGIAHNF